RLATNSKLWIGCAGCLAFIGLLASVSVTSSEKLADAARFVSQADETLSQLHSLDENLFRADDPPALKQVRATLDRLEELSSADPAKHQSIEHLRLLVERRIASSAGPGSANDIHQVVVQLASEQHRQLVAKTRAAGSDSASERFVAAGSTL